MDQKSGRRNPRYRVRLRTELVRGKAATSFATEDVSLSGFFLRTDTPPALRQLVQTRVYVPEEARAVIHGPESILLLGMVVHAMPQGNPTGRTPGIGVELRGRGGEDAQRWASLLQWVKNAHGGTVETPAVVLHPPMIEPVRRKHARYEGRFHIETASTAELLDIYTLDVSRGGMFLGTNAALPAGAKVRIDIVHPITKGRFTLDAVVRHGSKRGGTPGVGVEFVGLTDERRAAFFEFAQSGLHVSIDIA